MSQHNPHGEQNRRVETPQAGSDSKPKLPVSLPKFSLGGLFGWLPKFSAGNSPQLPPVEERRRLVVRLIILAIVLAAVFSPFVVARFFQSGPAQPNWYAKSGAEFELLFVPPAPSWPALIGDLGVYLPWVVWLVNVPLLLWQLRRERKLARESADFWIVLTITVVFWLVRVFPDQVGQVGSGILAWFGGVNPVPWAAVDLIPAAGILCLVVAYWRTVQGEFDWTPFTVAAVVIAVIYRGWDAADASWAKLFLGVGILSGVLEILRAPVSGQNKPTNGGKKGDRAAALSLVLGALVTFVILRALIGGFITSQIEATSAPPAFYLDLGRTLYANANLVSLVLAAVIAWQLRWQAGSILAGILMRLDSKRGLERLMPHPGIRFYDSTLLSHFTILAIWLFTGSL